MQRMDEKVCDTQKKLDLEKYKTSKKMAQLEELQTQYNQMEKDASEAVATDAGESAEAEVCSYKIRSTSIFNQLYGRIVCHPSGLNIL